MTWMWVAAGVLAGLYFVVKKNSNSREETEDIQEEPQAQAVPVTRNYGGTDEKRELREAIRAGEHALDSLHAAMERLDSARAWGVCDLLGGRSIASRIKFRKIDDANEWMQLANNDLRTFEKELGDVTGRGTYIRTGDLVSVLDMFCDNIVSDLTVQNRIKQAMVQIDSIIERVQDTVWTLKKKLDE